jgi:hypothetical protein
MRGQAGEVSDPLTTPPPGGALRSLLLPLLPLPGCHAAAAAAATNAHAAGQRGRRRRGLTLGFKCLGGSAGLKHPPCLPSTAVMISL